MENYPIPQSHLELLQRIWEELVLQRDPDALFTGQLGSGNEPTTQESDE